MKKSIIYLLTAAVTILLLTCIPENPAEQPPLEEAPTTAPTETIAELLTGWQTIGGSRYCYSQNGQPLTGWLTDAGNRYYLDETGLALTGWQELEGKTFYFAPDGAMTVGWMQLDGGTYYFGVDGALFRGLLNIGGKGYYFTETGLMHTGWLELEGKTYFFGEDGVMAVGRTEIEGQIHHFSPHGVKVLLVNPWNTLPADYEVSLVNLTEQDRMAEICADELSRMLADCKNAGHRIMIVSAYRTQADQEFLYNRKVNTLLEMGWSLEKARPEAAKAVAIPGTSEHQLGLAVDIIDLNYPYLDDYQAQMPAQKWLMEHCHEYGFILRYPIGTTEITGIIFEPWHYRYVGVEIAQEIMNLGITLEEYLGEG